MQSEIDKEKEEGIGLPTEVTNQVAQQQMMGQVDMENQIVNARCNGSTRSTTKIFRWF